MAQLEHSYECCKWTCASEFVYQCIDVVSPGKQDDLRVALFDHQQYGDNNRADNAAIKHIESLGSNYFYVVIVLTPCHNGQKEDDDNNTIKRQLQTRFPHTISMDVSSPSMVCIWRNKAIGDNGMVVKVLLDENDATKLNLEMGRQMCEPLNGSGTH